MSFYLSPLNKCPDRQKQENDFANFYRRFGYSGADCVLPLSLEMNFMKNVFIVKPVAGYEKKFLNAIR